MILWSRSITDPSGGNTQSEQKRKEECIPTMKGKGAPSTPVKKQLYWNIDKIKSRIGKKTVKIRRWAAAK